MTEQITIETLPAQPVFEVTAEPKLFQIPSVLASGFAEAAAAIEEAGAERTGMPYARYLEIDWGSLQNGALKQFIDIFFKRQKMQIGLKLASSNGANGVAFGTEIPAGRYVKTIHQGPYHKVGETYSRIVAWASDQGVTLANNSIEHYVDDPTEVPKNEVRTEVFVPVSE